MPTKKSKPSAAKEKATALSKDPAYKLANFYLRRSVLADANHINETRYPGQTMSAVLNDLLQAWVNKHPKK